MIKWYKYKCPTCGCEEFRLERFVTVHGNYELNRIQHRPKRYRYYCAHCGREAPRSEVISIAGMKRGEEE